MNWKRAIGYIRLYKLNRCGESFDKQMRSIQAYCAGNGYKLVRVYYDVSEDPHAMKRYAYHRMIQETAEGTVKADAILTESKERVTSDFDRLYDFEWWFTDNMKMELVYLKMDIWEMRTALPSKAKRITDN